MIGMSKEPQLKETSIKTKNCKRCNGNLPLDSFTSTKARYCKQCHRLDALDKQHKRTLKQLERTKSSKQKKKTVIKISDLKKKVQRVFNKWIRTRDEELPCISCQGICGKWDAGHFHAMGSTGALRYNEDNCHKQGAGCNKFKHGNLLEYRINLIKKIGQERVDWLEEHRNDVKKWQRDELEALLTRYKL